MSGEKKSHNMPRQIEGGVILLISYQAKYRAGTKVIQLHAMGHGP